MNDPIDIYTMLPGKTLIIGPSRSGKSYFSRAFKNANLNIVDTDHETDLITWRNDATGLQVKRPLKPNKKWLLENHFVINPNDLRDFLAKQGDVIVFAHSWNIMDVLDQFDRVAYMYTPLDVLEQRLTINRPDHEGGGSAAEIAFHRQRHIDRADDAKRYNLPFINTTLSPRDFYSELTQIKS